MRWLLTDPATWRDMLWLLVNCTAGVTLTMLTSSLLLGSAFCLCYPLLLALTSPGMFDAPFGLFTLHRPVDGFGLWIVGAVAFWLWWQFTPWLMRGWALMSAALLEPTRKAVLEGRVAALAASRADTVDSAAAEIRRIERDLHDGAQARLVALSMSLGLADELVADDPDRARVLLAEARQTTATVLQELRDLVRGIHPPVLADRGLVKAVRAMALDSPLPVGVRTTGFGDAEELRLPEPVEACAYFVVSEAMANIGKHARARRVEIRLELVDQTLYASIGDDGRGGARLNAGSGLTGLARRLAAFDGTLTVTSPPGGPTILTMELPCAPQSLKITPSSAKG
jgi:signal transduction histidine kinase